MSGRKRMRTGIAWLLALVALMLLLPGHGEYSLILGKDLCAVTFTIAGIITIIEHICKERTSNIKL